MAVPSFVFLISQSEPDAFEEVEKCVKLQLGSETTCTFLQTAAFTKLRRLALYEAGSHQGAIAFNGHGLCVKLFPDNRVLVKWA